MCVALVKLLTQRSRVLFEKITGSQLVKKFPAFYRTRRFITANTIARHLSLFGGSSIYSTPPHPTSWRSNLMLSFHLRLGLPSDLFPSGFPTKTLYMPLLSPIRATCPAYLILDSFTGTILVNEYRSLAHILLTWRIWWANNASKWQMGFNSAFKGRIFSLSPTLVK